MNTILLEPKSSWGTPLKSDIVMGHICHAMSAIHGHKLTEEFVSEFKQSPIFLLSNFFPENYLPTPFISLNKIVGFDINAIEGETGSSIKKILKGIEYLHISEFSDRILDYSKVRPTISKISNYHFSSVSVSDENKLFQQTEYYLENEAKLWGLINILNREKFKYYDIENLIRIIFEVEGYGTKKNSGKGLFNVSFSQNPLVDFFLDKNNSNLTISINDFIPLKKDKAKIEKYTYNVRNGKVYDPYNRFKNIFKKKIIFISQGATSTVNKEDFWGGILENITHSNSEEIYKPVQFGYSFNICIKTI